ncbi:MAG: rRNA synthase [Frankiaceae bacterium]|jgi:23S rRNA pseudouridine2605 synthase|nr:rRNA synthase [Frankiaceae bacterium]
MTDSQGDVETAAADGVRLQKVLAEAGVGSRRVCEQLISAGRVTVDGKVVNTLGARVHADRVVLHVDGNRIVTDRQSVYLALNKPLGIVSAMSDDRGRPTLSDFVPAGTPRVFHVGRLDAETEGLILLTNDGELAHRLTHPSFGVAKTYVARVAGEWTRDDTKRVEAGVMLDDRPVDVERLRLRQIEGGDSMVELTIHEGRNHVVRRLMDAVGHPVLALVRVSFGGVRLDGMKPGATRPLTVTEVQSLYRQVDM